MPSYPPNFSVPYADAAVYMAWPGGGKGTQIEHQMHDLSERGIPHVTLGTGAKIRDEVKRKTEFGLAVKRLPKGTLVPDELMIPRIAPWIERMRQEYFWFVDGLPRNLAQVPVFDEAMERANRSSVIVHIRLAHDRQATRQLAEERMRKRGEHAQRLYELDPINNPAPRDDDMLPAARAKRLNESEQLEDVIEYYKQLGKVISVDGWNAEKEVRHDINKLLFPLVRIGGGNSNWEVSSATY